MTYLYLTGFRKIKAYLPIQGRYTRALNSEKDLWEKWPFHKPFFANEPKIKDGKIKDR
jgi:hypothetical protein